MITRNRLSLPMIDDSDELSKLSPNQVLQSLTFSSL